MFLLAELLLPLLLLHLLLLLLASLLLLEHLLILLGTACGIYGWENANANCGPKTDF